MPWVRDPQTGLVSMARVSNNISENSYYKKYPCRMPHLKCIEEEWDEKGKRPLDYTEPEALFIGPQDPILLPGAENATECPNAQERKDLRIQNTSELDAIAPPESPFFNRLAQICCYSKIRTCRNTACLSHRSRLEKFAPRCEWPGFRDWALQALACQATLHESQTFTRPCFHLANAIDCCYRLVCDTRDKSQHIVDTLKGKDGVDVHLEAFGVFETIYWIFTILFSMGLGSTMDGRWTMDLLPDTITEPPVVSAAREAQAMGICMNRFWRLVSALERQHLDLPALAESAAGHPQLRQSGHEACMPSICQLSVFNSTKVAQLHKCREEYRSDCQERLHFDPELLNDSVKHKGRTVWTLAQPFRVSQSGPYLAVSHVWSDGTGIGLQPTGDVNKCLFDYFAGLAQSLGCTGIWWDTISIPNDPVLRRAAINNMHHNYANAQCTVVHDTYLAGLDWTDDGAPCIALVLSNWLTRGWTALELIMSRTVKVVYRDPDTGGPRIMDLDLDILAKDPSNCTRGHWVASSIVRRLRQPIDNVSSLIAVLKPRSTSWSQDMMVIAGLLAGVDNLDASQKPSEITKAIMDRVYRVNPSALCHGKQTITESGGWSWCPVSLFDIPSETLGDMFEAGTLGDRTCFVDKSGILFGCWYWRPLTEDDSTGHTLEPYADHMSAVLNIKDALRRWQCCMLLKQNNFNQGMGLLVLFVYDSEDRYHVQYVGSMRDISAKAGVFDPGYGYNFFSIGDEGSPAEVPPIDDPRPSAMDDSQQTGNPKGYSWLCGKLWLGDPEKNGQLLVVHKDGEIVIKANQLQVGVGGTVSVPEERVFWIDGQNGYGFSANELVSIHPVKPDTFWPPTTIPAQDRKSTPADSEHPDSCTLFQLKANQRDTMYAALDPELFTPSEECPYKGIWTGPGKDGMFIFLLFHQPNAARLEVIVLTGDSHWKSGSVMFVVENLDKTVSTDEKWNGLPVVRATTTSKDLRLEVLLISENEVLAILPLANSRMKRVAIKEYL